MSEKYGRFTVTKTFTQGRRQEMWNCLCECGREGIYPAERIRSGHVKSCGCLKMDGISALRATHRRTGTREHRIWIRMLGRCTNPNLHDYMSYGGRGIKVCDRWGNKETGFINFLANMGEAPADGSIERKDNDGPYSPENCRWATKTEQANNRRTSHRVEHAGRVQTVAEWSKETGIPYFTLTSRLKRGMTIADALTRPVRPVKR